MMVGLCFSATLKMLLMTTQNHSKPNFDDAVVCGAAQMQAECLAHQRLDSSPGAPRSRNALASYADLGQAWQFVGITNAMIM